MGTGASGQNRVHVVGGFTADAKREGSFLLASRAVADGKNRSVNTRPTEMLSNLHEPPVIVHPDTPLFLPNPNGGDSMVPPVRAENQPNPNDFLDEFQTHFPLDVQMAKGGRRGSAAGSVSMSVSIASSNTEDSSYNSRFATPADAARTLLAEMGTLRNMRKIFQQEVGKELPAPRITISHRAAHEKAGTAQYAQYFSANSVADTRYNHNEDEMFQGSLAMSQNTGYHSSNANANGNGNGNTDFFLTEGNFDGVGAGPGSGTGVRVRSRESNTKGPAIFQAQNAGTILTSADLQRMKSRYMNVRIHKNNEGAALSRDQNDPADLARTITKGNNTSAEENSKFVSQLPGGTISSQTGIHQPKAGMDGRPLSPTWYPVPMKPEYLLAKQTQDSVDREMEQLGLASPIGSRPTTEKTERAEMAAKLTKLNSTNSTSAANFNGNGLPKQKKKHLVTYTTTKLTLKPTMQQSRSEKFISSLGGQRTFEEGQARMGSENVITGLQPRIKTKVSMSAANLLTGLEQSSLDGTRENYQASTRLELNKGFKLRSNTPKLRTIGIGLEEGRGSPKFN